MSVEIPKGLTRCDRCGEFTGETLLDDESVEVVCACHGTIPCPKCGERHIRRPISNYFDERTGDIWHVPWCGCMISCPAREP